MHFLLLRCCPDVARVPEVRAENATKYPPPYMGVKALSLHIYFTSAASSQPSRCAFEHFIRIAGPTERMLALQLRKCTPTNSKPISQSLWRSLTGSDGLLQTRRTFTVLALESSADDTCAAVVTSDRKILSNVVISQHKQYVHYFNTIYMARLLNVTVFVETCGLRRNPPVLCHASPSTSNGWCTLSSFFGETAAKFLV